MGRPLSVITPDEDHGNRRRQRHHENPQRPAEQTENHSRPSHPPEDAVRSFILPKNGFPAIVDSAAVPATSDKLFGARCDPISAFTLRAKVTRRGARHNSSCSGTPTCTAR